jgi:hypothetical protein
MGQTGCSYLGPDQNCTVDDAEPPNQTSVCSLLFLKVTFRSALVYHADMVQPALNMFHVALGATKGTKIPYSEMYLSDCPTA